MKITIVLLLLIKVSLIELISTNHTNKAFTTDGEIYDPEQYPYLVKIELIRHGFELCTGSLITALYVLTNAHCVFNSKKENIKVYSGPIHNENIRNVVQIHTHHDFNEQEAGYSADLSLIKINKSFPNVKRFIKIGGDPKEFENQQVVECVSIGFGLTNYGGTKGVAGYIMINRVTHGEYGCPRHKNEELEGKWYQYLCTMRYDATPCHGDGGAPMICNDKLYGVYSFAVKNEYTFIDCDSVDIRAVYVFLNYHLKWINSIVNVKKTSCAKNLLKPRHALHIILVISLLNVLIGL